MRTLFWIGLLAVAVAILSRRGRRTTSDFLVEVAAASSLGAVLAFVLAPGFFGGLRLLTDLLFFALPGFLVVLVRRVDADGTRRATNALALMLLGVGVWATQIEPRWLEITHHRIASPKIERPVRLVVVADLQTDRWGHYERRILREIAEQRPHVVLLTGDYFQASGEQRRRLAAEFRNALAASHVRPKYGIYAVQGDVEADGWERDFEGTGIETLTESRRFLAAGLTFTALDRETSRHGTQSDLLPVRPGRRFHVVFGHAPDYALAHPPADLLLAGHVHGGQVRLPLLGPLLTLSAVPRDWAVGRTDWAGGAGTEGGRTLIVSRGLGMERGQAPRIRFLCRPELVVVDLVPEDGGGGGTKG